MPRFNPSASSRQTHRPPDTVNLAGGRAYDLPPKHRLINHLLNSFLVDRFYQSASVEMEGLAQTVAQLDDLFIAQAAIFARREFGMRSITHALIVEWMLARQRQHKAPEEWVKKAIAKIIQRPDDITEVLALWRGVKGQKKLPNALKKGLSLAFNQFDSYQLRKWSGKGNDWKLVDAVRLLHPIPTERNRDGLADLIKGDFSTGTRQSDMVKATQGVASSERGAAMASVWAKKFEAPSRIPYTDLLRGLKSIAANAPDLLPAALGIIRDPERVRQSRLFPFQIAKVYLTFERELAQSSKYTQLLLGALSQAVDASLNNIPNLPNTLVAVDVSGSMAWSNAAGSGGGSRSGPPMTCLDVGLLFGAAVSLRSGADLLLFDNRVQWIGVNPHQPVMSLMAHMRSSPRGGGTDFEIIFTSLNRSYERIIIFSDMQGWIGRGAPQQTFTSYVQRFGQPWVYSCDLSSYGTAMFPTDGSKVISLAGYSDKIFDLMRLGEEDPSILVSRVEETRLD